MRRKEVTVSIPATLYTEFDNRGLTVILLNYNYFFGEKILGASDARSTIADMLRKYLVSSPARLHPIHLSFLVQWHGDQEGVARAIGMSAQAFTMWINSPDDSLSISAEVYIRNATRTWFQMPLYQSLEERKKPSDESDDPPIMYVDAANHDSLSNWSVVPAHLFALAETAHKQ